MAFRGNWSFFFGYCGIEIYNSLLVQRKVILSFVSMEKTGGILAFEDGTVFEGLAFGAKTTVMGEAVFNTSMTGYQEILTDPSYWGQIITMTTPHIGNYGINESDEESEGGPKVRGLVVREVSPITSNWRSEITLDDYLKKYGIPGLQGVDTRSITKKIRVAGALKACLSTEGISAEEAVQKARDWEGLVGFDFAEKVTCPSQYVWDEAGEYATKFTVKGTLLDQQKTPENRTPYKVVALDFGAKKNIFNLLRNQGLNVLVVPADTSVDEIKALQPDGIFLSNGPGDPAAVTYAHETVRDLLDFCPIFGICMGHQIITHAIGASTYKLKFGHRGANQPVKDLRTGQVAITAQNHGFAASREEVEAAGAEVTHVNLNDNTVAGLRHKTLPVFSVQHHPEASPGPHDAEDLFEQFYHAIAESKKNSVGVS